MSDSEPKKAGDTWGREISAAAMVVADQKPEVVYDLPASMEAELSVPIDIAADIACKELGLPILGGPSGKGWSRFSTAQTCPYLYKMTYENGADGRERTKPAEQLQVGGLFHLLIAMYYAYGLGDGAVFYRSRGLLAPRLVKKLGMRGRRRKSENLIVPNDAADQLLAYVKDLANNGLTNDLKRSTEESVVPLPRPSMSVILQAERLFDAHTNFYGSGQEDVTPLALEWFAEHPLLGYTCRYDAIVELGENDPFVRDGALKAGSVCIIEHKSSKWLSEWARDGWFLDGEILGQLLLWGPSGCEKLFGPLGALIIDIVTKEKSPKFLRILISRNPATVRSFEQGISYQNAEISLWQATGFYPRRTISCFRYGAKCGLYQHCQSQVIADGESLGGEDE